MDKRQKMVIGGWLLVLAMCIGMVAHWCYQISIPY